MGRWCVGNREKNTWERKTVNETKQGRERGKDRVIEKGLWERKQRELKTLEREISWKSASELGWSYLDCPASSKTTGWHRIVSLWNSTPRENNSQDYDIYANIPRNHDKWKKKVKQKYPKIKKVLNIQVYTNVCCSEDMWGDHSSMGSLLSAEVMKMNSVRKTMVANHTGSNILSEITLGHLVKACHICMGHRDGQ